METDTNSKGMNFVASDEAHFFASDIEPSCKLGTFSDGSIMIVQRADSKYIACIRNDQENSGILTSFDNASST